MRQGAFQKGRLGEDFIVVGGLGRHGRRRHQQSNQESSRGNDRSEDSHGTTPKQHRAIDNRNYSVQPAAPARCNARCSRIAYLMEMFLLRRRQERWEENTYELQSLMRIA